MFPVLWSRYQAYDLEIMHLKKLMEDNKERYDIVKTLSKLTFKYAEKVLYSFTSLLLLWYYFKNKNNDEEQVQSIDGVFCLHSCHSLHIMCYREL